MWLVVGIVVFIIGYVLIGLFSPRYRDKKYDSQLEDSDESNE